MTQPAAQSQLPQFQFQVLNQQSQFQFQVLNQQFQLLPQTAVQSQLPQPHAWLSFPKITVTGYVRKIRHGIKNNCRHGMIWAAQSLHDPRTPRLGSVANLLGMIFEFLA